MKNTEKSGTLLRLATIMVRKLLFCLKNRLFSAPKKSICEVYKVLCLIS